MCASETPGGGVASARRRARAPRDPAAASAARARVRTGPARAGTSGPARPEPRHEPRCRLLHPPVLGEAARELLRGLLGLEVVELGRLVREELPRLQLEERGYEHEELAARLQVELVAGSHQLDEGEDDRRDVDVARLEILLQQERQEQVERALERVEVELELTHGCRGRDGTERRLARGPGRDSAQRLRDRQRLLAVELALEPVRDPVVLPQEHVSGQARGLLDELARLVHEHHGVRLAAEEERRGAPSTLDLLHRRSAPRRASSG